MTKEPAHTPRWLWSANDKARSSNRYIVRRHRAGPKRHEDRRPCRSGPASGDKLPDTTNPRRISYLPIEFRSSGRGFTQDLRAKNQCTTGDTNGSSLRWDISRHSSDLHPHASTGGGPHFWPSDGMVADRLAGPTGARGGRDARVRRVEGLYFPQLTLARLPASRAARTCAAPGNRRKTLTARLGSAFPLRQGVVNELGPPELSDLQLIANFPSSGKCRAGGETRIFAETGIRDMGPSPRGRGNPAHPRSLAAGTGTIPARAGKPLVHPSGVEGLISAQAVRGFASMVQRKGLAMVALK